VARPQSSVLEKPANPGEIWSPPFMILIPSTIRKLSTSNRRPCRVIEACVCNARPGLSHLIATVTASSCALALVSEAAASCNPQSSPNHHLGFCRLRAECHSISAICPEPSGSCCHLCDAGTLHLCPMSRPVVRLIQPAATPILVPTKKNVNQQSHELLSYLRNGRESSQKI
jgi:hypothetical protein